MSTAMAQARLQEEMGSARTSISTSTPQPTQSPQQKEKKRKGLRHAIKKWKDGLKSDHSPSPSRTPSRAPSNASPLAKVTSASTAPVNVKSPVSTTIATTTPEATQDAPAQVQSSIPESTPAEPSQAKDLPPVPAPISTAPSAQPEPSAISNLPSNPSKTPPIQIQLPPRDKDRDKAAENALFKSTCQTTIHSPLDKRHSKPSIRRNYLGSRRFTAPADYFGSEALSSLKSKPDSDGTTQDPAKPPSSSGNMSLGRRASKLRSPFSKRASVASPPRTSTSSRPSSTLPTTHEDSPPSLAPLSISTPAPLSPSALSEPSPPAYSNTHSTWAYTTASEIAALAAAHEARLLDAAAVIQRDKPRDYYDPGWRELERKEAEKKVQMSQEEEKRMMEELGGAGLRGGDQRDGVLKRWEWGR